MEIGRVGRGYAAVVPHVSTSYEARTQLPLWQLHPRGHETVPPRTFSTESYGNDHAANTGGVNDIPKSRWATLFPEAHILYHKQLLGGLIRDFITHKELAARARQRICEGTYAVD